MKQYKYQMPDFALYEYHYVQQHLMDMASKGWRLDRINGLGLWRYRRAEPANIRYEVTYAPSASAYNSRPTCQEEALSDLCAEAGWVKVASLAQLHIYCNEDPNATPLETDESGRIQTIRRAMNKSFVREHLLLIVLFLIQCVMQLRTIFKYPARSLAQPLTVGNALMTGILVLLYGINLLGYFRWIKRAENAVREGLPGPEAGFYRRFRVVLWVFILVYLVLLLCSAQLWLVGGMLVIVTAVFISARLLINLCKKLNAPKWVNIAVPFVVTWVLMMIAMGIFFTAADGLSLSSEPPHPDSLPLMIQDLTDPGDETLECTIWEESASPLSSYGRYYHDSTAEDSRLNLSYTILDVKCPLIYEMCCNDLEQQFETSASFYFDGSIKTNVGHLWDAEYAVRSSGDFGDRWFICWDSRIVILRAGWPLSEEEITAAAAILKP